MASSSIPAAKAGILALLTARANLATVQVAWAHPGAKIEAESVFFGECREDERAVSLGQRKRNEQYTFDVIVSVHEAGDDAQAAETRCWQLVAEVENALRDVVSASSIAADVVMAQIAGKTQRNYAEGEGRVAECVVSIDVQARI